MIEGELKKRITKAYSEYYRGDGSFGSKITDAIIDEAKKDMLENYHSFGELHTQPDFICIDYKKWKKWFGDSS